MQRLPFPHLVAQRYDHGELQAAVSGVVQNDVPDELHKKGILHQRTPEAIRIEALRTGMGDGTQTPQGDIETGKKEKHVRYFKARVLDSHQSEGINGVVRDCMEDDAIVFSDKSTSYVDISDLVELHVTEKSDAKTTKETLKWVHIAISNAKRTLLGNYHKIKRKYLQLYLNEFIYKLNRRYFGDKLFDRLVIANITGA